MYYSNGAAIFVGRAAIGTILCFNVHPTVGYLISNVPIGQLLQRISRFIVVCARSRPKMLAKTYNKHVCQALFITTAFY